MILLWREFLIESLIPSMFAFQSSLTNQLFNILWLDLYQGWKGFRKAFFGAVKKVCLHSLLQNSLPSLSRNCWLIRFLPQQKQQKQWGQACQWYSPWERPGESAVIILLQVLHIWNRMRSKEYSTKTKLQQIYEKIYCWRNIKTILTEIMDK